MSEAWVMLSDLWWVGFMFGLIAYAVGDFLSNAMILEPVRTAIEDRIEKSSAKNPKTWKDVLQYGATCHECIGGWVIVVQGVFWAFAAGTLSALPLVLSVAWIVTRTLVSVKEKWLS